MSKHDAITVTCPATADLCRCGLDPHPADVPHQCVDADPQCGGMWFDHPTDPNKLLVVRWPGLRGGPNAERAKRLGITDPPPGEPVEDYREVPFTVARGPITFLPPP